MSYYLTRDHLGSIHDVTAASGDADTQYMFDAFGEVSKLKSGIDVDFQFGGYYRHSRSGLNLTLFRAYNPTLARWLSRDPIEEEAGVNLYTYVHNRPSEARDGDGLREGPGVGIGAPTTVSPLSGLPNAGRALWLLWQIWVEVQRRERIEEFNRQQRKKRGDCLRHYEKVRDDCLKAIECLRDKDPEEYERMRRKCMEDWIRNRNMCLDNYPDYEEDPGDENLYDT